MTLAVIGPAPTAERRTQADAAGLHVRDLGGELDWTADTEGEVAAAAARLFALVSELRPHLLHLNSPALAAFGPFPAPVLAACHSCMATWWAAMKGEAPLPSDLAWRTRLTARGYAAADALLAPSRAFAEATRITYRLPVAPETVLNGRSPLILPLWERGTSEAGGGGSPPSVGAGPLSPLRGQLPRRGSICDVAIFTAGRLWDEGKDVATLDRAVGRTSLHAAAAGQLTGSNGHGLVLHHVRPLGRLSETELSTRLASRPIFVSPSLYEPFGLAVLEAARAGCPLVLSDIATFRELWDGAAIFFPPGDDATLAAHLDALAKDAGRRMTLGEAAHVRAIRYTASAMAEATLRLYARLSPAFAPVEAAA